MHSIAETNTDQGGLKNTYIQYTVVECVVYNWDQHRLERPEIYIQYSLVECVVYNWYQHRLGRPEIYINTVLISRVCSV